MSDYLTSIEISEPAVDALLAAIEFERELIWCRCVAVFEREDAASFVRRVLDEIARRSERVPRPLDRYGICLTPSS